MKVSLIAAITADGLIGKDQNHLADWTSPEDKKLFVKLTKEAGVMVLGSRTFDTIGRALPGRRMIVLTSRPERYSVENVEFTNESPSAVVARLEQEGATGLAICGGSQVYTEFMQQQLVDDLYLSVEPLLFGTGVSLFNANVELKMSLQEVRQLNAGTVLLHYSLNR
jgi:dihydrofolate reductase